MYLNYPLVPGFPLTLRYGEERHQDFLAKAFTEVWAKIPEMDRAAILARGYGRVDVDVMEKRELHGPADMGGDLLLKRSFVDSHAYNVVRHLVARELARKVDDFTKPKPLSRPKEPREEANWRVFTILERWGYPARVKPEYTAADRERIRANRNRATPEESQDNSP